MSPKSCSMQYSLWEQLSFLLLILYVSVLQTKLQPLLVPACWCGDRTEAGDRQGRATQLNCSPILQSGLALLPECSYIDRACEFSCLFVSITYPGLQDIPFSSPCCPPDRQRKLSATLQVCAGSFLAVK